MASSKPDLRLTGAAIAALAASLMAFSIALADTVSSSASASAASNPSGSAEAADLDALIRAQLGAIVPQGMRVDRVELGCRPAAGSALKAVAPGLALLTSRSFMVELQKDDRSTYCSATMDASRQVLTATRDIQPGQPLNNTDFQAQWVDAFGAAPGALVEFPNLGPYVSATQIRSGQPLFQNALLRPIAVHPGELVMVTVKNGPVRLRAQLQAQSQGAVGDSVTLINPASGTPVMVVVTGPRSAELVLQ